MNTEVIECIITGMCKLNKDDSSSNGGSMPSLQERDQDDWSNDNGIDSYGEDGMYDNGEYWGYKARTLK